MSQAPNAVPILFLPGTLCDARVFDALSSQIAANRALYADLTADLSVDEAATRILASLPECFIAVGFSLGAIVALELAARAPERVTAMVLIAGNARNVPETDHPARRTAVLGVEPGALVGQNLWSRSVHPANLGRRDVQDLVVAMARSCPPGTAERQTEIALSRSDSRSRLASLTMPVLILSGSNDMIAPEAFQLEMAQSLPDSDWTRVPDAGHFLLLEQPVACAAAFCAWLVERDRQHCKPTDSHALEVS